MTTRFLFIADQPLFASSACRDLLDMALSAAAFDLPSSLLLRGQATQWVAACQAQPGAIGHKDLYRQLGALGIYGIDQIHVAQQDLLRFTDTFVADDCQLLDPAAVQALIRQHERVIQL